MAVNGRRGSRGHVPGSPRSTAAGSGAAIGFLTPRVAGCHDTVPHNDTPRGKSLAQHEGHVDPLFYLPVPHGFPREG